ncbi:hypothetical protein M2163_006263 [Streptomyces sp. SAI-135]|uniref:DUF6542 domain-containing protein n=1 Tax=unclassified Streptomyces TaxID=2593676 RepID=UPI0024769BDF|nr:MULTISPECIES: DUF6542 domain-containing protein [unclassified Streptomyces]MDH6516756.1 hypothetical protein [Streptomyces sp. SAI-090]MDH6548970.1 hypothetical protein [Streptomyces sp. SAI-041]MDH6568038.1 hypothetical protein [Streptomyces sp. SAI-117]MDH6619155.1 hypothetical protein [Streptomyces sp. SAI-135]
MEQHRTRPPHNGTRRPDRGAPLPAQARGERRPPVARRPPPPVVRTLRRLRRLPNPRLTGLGGGLFCAGLMILLGFLVSLLFGSSLTLYGVLFVPVSVLTSVWLRRGDLLTAPIVVPIAFAAGLVPVADSGGGTSGRLMGLFTALATQAGWLYAGTLAAGLVALIRRIRLVRARSR